MLPRKKGSHFHLYSWQGLDPNDFIGYSVALHDKTRFIASAVCGNSCLSAVRFPTRAAKNAIDLFSVSRKSLGIPLHE